MQVIDQKSGVAFAGESPTKPWTDVCLAHRTGQRISGPLYFGFSDLVNQRAIAGLYTPLELQAALQVRAACMETLVLSQHCPAGSPTGEAAGRCRPGMQRQPHVGMHCGTVCMLRAPPPSHLAACLSALPLSPEGGSQVRCLGFRQAPCRHLQGGVPRELPPALPAGSAG